MTQTVDDIWAALKSRSAPGSARSKRGLPDVQPVAVPARQPPDARHGPGLEGPGPSLRTPSGAADGGQPDSASWTAPLQRHINGLVDENRATRLKAVKQLKEAFAERSASGDAAAVEQAFSGVLQQRIVVMLADESEACREAALAVLATVASAAASIAHILPAAMQALKQRLGVGGPTVLEDSEELRHGLARFVGESILGEHADEAREYVDDLAALLARSSEDSFHETKRAALQGIERLLAAGDPGRLAVAVPSLVDAIVAVMQHQHSRVRMSAVAALGALMRRVAVPRDLLTGKVVPALKTAAVDRNAGIRQAVFHAVAVWLGAGGAETSAGSPVTRAGPHAALVLPVLLLGLTDGSADVASAALADLESAAAHHCAAVLDAEGTADRSPADADAAASTSGRSTPPADAAMLPPPFCGRAPPAARRMVQSVLPELLPPVMREVREWTVALRLTASRTLFGVAALAEAALLPHLPVLLPALCSAVGDHDEAVALRIVKTAQIVGAYCEPQHWMPLLIDGVSASTAAPTQLTGGLVIMAAALHAAFKAGKPIGGDLSQRIAAWLASPDVRALQAASTQRQLAMVVANLVDAAGREVQHVAQPLLHALLHLEGSLKQDAYALQQTQEACGKLAAACSCAGTAELASRHAAPLLTAMLQRSDAWTHSHPDLPAFASLLQAVPGPTLRELGTPLCLAVGSVTKDHDREAPLRVALLQMVDQLLENEDQGRHLAAEHGLALFAMVLLPPLVWRAGKSTAAVRYAALTGVYTALHKRRITAEQLRPLLSAESQLVPLLVQSMDEDWYVETRRLGCFAMAALLRVAGSHLDDEMRRQIYPEINKRMDDSNDAVRVANAASAAAFAEHAMPAEYCDTNTGYFVSALLIHLDDSNADVRDAVFEALRPLAAKKPAVLTAEINKVYGGFRAKEPLDRLLQSCAH